MSMYEKVGTKFFSELLKKGDDAEFQLALNKDNKGKKTQKVDIRITPVLYQRIRLMALENGRSMSNFLQMLIAREWHFRAHARATAAAFASLDVDEEAMVKLANEVDPIDSTLNR